MEHALGFSGVGGGGVLEPLTPSDFLRKSKIVGNSRAPSQNPGSHLPEILEFLHHQTASFVSAPEKRQYSCHVIQPRARINVSCSRADQKGTKGAGGVTKGPAKASSGWVPDLGARTEAEQDGTGRDQGLLV